MTKIKQFEYLESIFRPTDNHNNLAEALNDYGRAGWQVVSLERGKWFTNAVFMRKTQAIPKNTEEHKLVKKPGTTTTRF